MASLNRLNRYVEESTGLFSCLSATKKRELRGIIELLSTNGTNLVAQCREVHNQSVKVRQEAQVQANRRSWKGIFGGIIGVGLTVAAIATANWVRSNFDITIAKKLLIIQRK